MGLKHIAYKERCDPSLNSLSDQSWNEAGEPRSTVQGKDLCGIETLMQDSCLAMTVCSPGQSLSL